MRILIGGATGFIGSHIKDFLEKKGHEVICLVRDRSLNGIYCNVEKNEIEQTKLEGFDVVILLNGENIAKKRWSKKQKKKIFSSRVDSVRFISECLSKLKNKPKCFLTASAIGYYGDQKTEVVENCPHGMDFLSHVCKHWEEAAILAKEAKIHTAHFRLGMVLGKDGGPLKKMLSVFRLYLGGKIGKGDQYISWIAIDDVCYALLHLIEKDICGPVNFTSPTPVTNKEFTDILAKVLNKKALFTIPSFIIKIMLGQMGKELLLTSINAFPKVLVTTQYSFRYLTLEKALRHIILGENDES